MLISLKGSEKRYKIVGLWRFQKKMKNGSQHKSIVWRFHQWQRLDHAAISAFTWKQSSHLTGLSCLSVKKFVN